jgi:hypothetical protein
MLASRSARNQQAGHVGAADQQQQGHDRAQYIQRTLPHAARPGITSRAALAADAVVFRIARQPQRQELPPQHLQIALCAGEIDAAPQPADGAKISAVIEIHAAYGCPRSAQGNVQIGVVAFLRPVKARRHHPHDDEGNVAEIDRLSYRIGGLLITAAGEPVAGHRHLRYIVGGSQPAAG